MPKAPRHPKAGPAPSRCRHPARADLPPAYLRASYSLIGGIVLLFTGFISLVLLPNLGVSGGPAFDWSLGAVIAIGISLAARAIHRITRVFDRARAADWTLCPKCLYDLRDHDEEGACPECGRRFTRRAVQSCWIDAYAYHTRWRE